MKRAALLIFVFSGFSAGVFGQQLPVVNDTNTTMKLMVYEEAHGHWGDSVLLTKGKRKLLDLETPGKFYLVAREELPRRDYPIGWFDVHAMIRSDPGLELRLSVCKACGTAYEEYWCHRCRTYHTRPVRSKKPEADVFRYDWVHSTPRGRR